MSLGTDDGAYKLAWLRAIDEFNTYSKASGASEKDLVDKPTANAMLGFKAPCNYFALK